MKLLTLTCNECGAPLEVPAKTKFLTCSYCSARLAVQHSSSAVYTEVLETIGRRTEQLADDVETLKLQNRLLRLDREWSEERQRYLVHDKHGRQHVPGTAGGAIGVVMAVGFGIFWIITAGSMGAPGFIPLFGLAVIVIGVLVGISHMGKAEAYRTARRRYERRRRELVDRLQSQAHAESPRDT